MMEMFIKGGPLMWPILACSVAAFAITLYKGRQYWEILRGMAYGRKKPTRAFCGPLAVVAEAIMSGSGEKEIAAVGSRQLRVLERGLGSLSLISVISPLLGLTGTVLGMIQAFQVIEAHGSRVDPGMLAGGIWQALITTAAGLLVAIPSHVALHYLERQMDSITWQLKELVESCLRDRKDGV